MCHRFVSWVIPDHKGPRPEFHPTQQPLTLFFCSLESEVWTDCWRSTGGLHLKESGVQSLFCCYKCDLQNQTPEGASVGEGTDVCLGRRCTGAWGKLNLCASPTEYQWPQQRVVWVVPHCSLTFKARPQNLSNPPDIIWVFIERGWEGKGKDEGRESQMWKFKEGGKHMVIFPFYILPFLAI